MVSGSLCAGAGTTLLHAVRAVLHEHLHHLHVARHGREREGARAALDRRRVGIGAEGEEDAASSGSTPAAEAAAAMEEEEEENGGGGDAEPPVAVEEVEEVDDGSPSTSRSAVLHADAVPIENE